MQSQELQNCMKPKPLFPLVVVLVVLAVCAVLSWVRPSLETRAGRGYAEAQYQWGKCCYYGIGIVQSDSSAAKWFLLAARQGHAKAQAALGVLYARGLGLPVNYPKALFWLSKGCEQGQAMAQNQMGILCAQGRGMSQNLDEAIRWFKLAANQGYRAAEENLRLTIAAKERFIAKVTTSKGRTYQNLEVKEVDSNGITVCFRPAGGGLGLAKLAFKDMPAHLQARYGFSPTNARQQTPSADELQCVVAQRL